MTQHKEREKKKELEEREKKKETDRSGEFKVRRNVRRVKRREG